MGFSSMFYRGIRLLCRPFVKLDNRIQRKIAQKEKAKEKAETDWVQAFPNANARDAFFERIGVITHAGGGLQGLAYLNCEEAFPYYYEKGNRVFEYDVDEKKRRVCIGARGKRRNNGFGRTFFADVYRKMFG